MQQRTEIRDGHDMNHVQDYVANIPNATEGWASAATTMRWSQASCT